MNVHKDSFEKKIYYCTEILRSKEMSPYEKLTEIGPIIWELDKALAKGKVTINDKARKTKNPL
jgi:hypothetical protein